MLLEFNLLQKYNIAPTGVIHVGMHKAEEYPTYKKAGVKHMLFIEANKKLVDEFLTRSDIDDLVYVANAAISNKKEVIQFIITNNGESSSILELKDHSKIYPHIVETQRIEMTTKTLDNIMDIMDGYRPSSDFNIINLDIQGAELKAMQGFTDWKYIDAVFTEVNYREMYAGCPMIEEITEFLLSKGLNKVEEVDTGCGWGDALYVR